MAPRQVGKEERSQQILEAATAVFAEHGYNAATIDAVAERAGVAKGTIYQYFKSKQDLFFGVFNARMNHYFESVQEQPGADGSTAEEQLRRTARVVFELAKTDQDVLSLTFEFWAASASSELQDRFAGVFRHMYSMFRGFFGAIITRGIERGEFARDLPVDSVVAVLVGAFDGLFLQSWFDPRMDAARAGEDFMNVFIKGLKKGGRTPAEVGGDAKA